MDFLESTTPAAQARDMRVQQRLDYMVQILHAARLRQGLSRKTAGALIGVTGHTIGNFERGEAALRFELILAYADALQVPPPLLFPADPAAPLAQVVQALSRLSEIWTDRVLAIVTLAAERTHRHGVSVPV